MLLVGCEGFPCVREGEMIVFWLSLCAFREGPGVCGEEEGRDGFSGMVAGIRDGKVR